MTGSAPPTNPQGAEGEPRYGSLWRRLLAFLLDNAICLVVLMLVASLIPADAYESDAVAILALALFTAWFNYFAIAEWRWGKTIGKSSLSLEVRSESGEPLSWNAAALRNLARILDVIVIGPLLIATTPTRQRLGDRFAHTVVLDTKRTFVPAAGVPAAAGRRIDDRPAALLRRRGAGVVAPFLGGPLGAAAAARRRRSTSRRCRLRPRPEGHCRRCRLPRRPSRAGRTPREARRRPSARRASASPPRRGRSASCCSRSRS